MFIQCEFLGNNRLYVVHVYSVYNKHNCEDDIIQKTVLISLHHAVKLMNVYSVYNTTDLLVF